LAPFDREKTLWKNGSVFGKSIVDPLVIATTRGTNASSFWVMVARIAGSSARFGGSFRKTMTFAISEAFGGGLLTRREG
jgi:hypothetical protein